MKEKSYEELDDLLAHIRLLLLKVRISDSKTADELKSLINQLEFWVESLVVDSLKLKELKSAKKRVKAPPASEQKKSVRKPKAR
jgi:hypothetical protein